MKIITEEYIKRCFTRYYSRKYDTIISPNSLKNREFGFLLFKDKTMVRHKNFHNHLQLQRFIVELTPSDAYYSAAYYQEPEVDMEKKGWVGADIIFDIDADHIETPCRDTHDKWICMKCSKSGNGKAPTACPECDGKIRDYSWICEKCLENAKKESIKLIELLEDDFGLSSDKIKVNFTGHRGYHIHVLDKNTLHLGSDERKEIVDYVTMLGFDNNIHFESDERKKIVDYVSILDINDDLVNLFKKRDLTPTNWMIRIFKELKKVGITRKKFISEVEKIKQQLSIKVDTVVTTDIHRLIRLVGTLNGKTGMKVVNVPLNGLPSFDPLTDAIAIQGDPIKIYIKEAPKFRLANDEFGPFKNEKVELPLEAAILLICKKRAKLN